MLHPTMPALFADARADAQGWHVGVQLLVKRSAEQVIKYQIFFVYV